MVHNITMLLLFVLLHFIYSRITADQYYYKDQDHWKQLKISLRLLSLVYSLLGMQ